jgi:hypothetical protein
MTFVAHVRRKIRGPAVAIAVAAALAVALACCENVLGISGEVTLSTEACGMHARAGDCRSCVATHCCHEATMCAQDGICGPQESCALGCGSDYACRSRCGVDNQHANPEILAGFETCIARSCNDACGMECGVAVGFTEPDAAQACEDCLARNCGATEQCTTDYGCQLVAHCVGSCLTPDCRTQCFAQDGGSLFVAEAIQVGLQCLQQCDIGELWSCVGSVSYPLTVPGPADIKLTITDSQTSDPFKRISVRACPAGTDRMCTNPPGMGTTDDGGNVALTLPVVRNAGYGFSGYFDITIPTAPSGSQEYLFFLSYPLSVQHATLGITLYSPTELANFVASASYVPDPTRGTLLVTANDCLSIPAPNVTFVASGTDDKTKEVYQEGSLLNVQATATDRSGAVVFLNAPAAPITVYAKPAPLGGAISSKVDVFVKPGALSIVQAIPTQQ